MRFKKTGMSIAAAASVITIGAATVPNAFAATTNTVRVQSGDSLWKIAHAHHISVQSLEQANPSVSPNNLAIGTILRLPSLYTVQSGDTLWKISRQYGVTPTSLQAANKGINPVNLRIGKVLIIPSQHSSGTTTQSPLVSTTSQSSSSYSSTDLYWMTHLIHAEAGSQPMKAKIAVGDVIMNRVHSPNYPNSVKGVIFQVANGHYQFTPVLNGYIYSSPGSTDRQAALDVLKYHDNIVPSAFVFYTPSGTPAASWVRKQPYVAQYGQLVFAK
ncbi:LysM peptidoglycan-binding domain-containing protein [Alicyclobacillus sp. SO9]|uniref:LysM peptidoglycan-binding domain-containing protein n=1 Tax=Alicyclobacillus sp. SO9 TaxID=2665646 RepID=UPI0018E7EDE6|nr:LysM peptidoglycan-binding domain-containing protein [Alicyclobacillus sp. SO9]QQE79886.1 LysM peptidoglycan-binding domain-containing protein [Alicyclobacillus sp. SO9]